MEISLNILYVHTIHLYRETILFSSVPYKYLYILVPKVRTK
jgi:hypothetical protein